MNLRQILRTAAAARPKSFGASSSSSSLSSALTSCFAATVAGGSPTRALPVEFAAEASSWGYNSRSWLDAPLSHSARCHSRGSKFNPRAFLYRLFPNDSFPLLSPPLASRPFSSLPTAMQLQRERPDQTQASQHSRKPQKRYNPSMISPAYVRVDANSASTKPSHFGTNNSDSGDSSDLKGANDRDVIELTPLDSDSVKELSLHNSMLEVRPADLKGLEEELKLNNRVSAYHKFIDICMSENDRHLLQRKHVNSLLRLQVKRKPRPLQAIVERVCQYSEELGLRLDTEGYNLLLESQVRSSYFSGAKKVLARMVAAGSFVDVDGKEIHVAPNADTYDLMLEAYFTAYKSDGARQFLDNMIEKGVKPTTRTFNIMVEGLLKAERILLAQQYLEIMDIMGVPWDQRTLNIYIKVLSELKTPQEVEDMAATAVAERNLVLNTANTTAIAKLWMDAQLPDKAISVCEAFLERAENLRGDALLNFGKPNAAQDSLPDTKFFSTLINGYIRAGDMDGARRTLSSMVKMGCSIDGLTVFIFVKGLCDSRNPEAAERMIADIEKNQLQVATADIQESQSSLAARSKSVIMSRYFELDRVEDAVRVFEDLESRQPNVSAEIRNQLLKGLASKFEIDALLQYWERWLQACSEGPQPAAAIETLPFSGSKKTVRRVPHHVMALRTNPPNAQSHSIVIEALIDCHKIDLAAKSIKNMVEKNKLQPHPHLFVKLVEAHVRGRNYLAAAETIMLMRQSLGASKGADAKNVKSGLELKLVIRSQSSQFERVMLSLLDSAESMDSTASLSATDPAGAHGRGAFGRVGTSRARILPDVYMASLPSALDPSRSLSTSDILEARQKRILGAEIYRELVAAGCSLKEESYAKMIRAHHWFGDLVSAVKVWSTFRGSVTTVSERSSKSASDPTSGKEQQPGGAGTAIVKGEKRASISAPLASTVTTLLECVRDVGKAGSAKAVLEMVRQESLPIDSRGRAATLCMMAKFGWSEELISALVDLSSTAREETIPPLDASTGVTPDLVAMLMRYLRMSQNKDAERAVVGFLEECFPEALSAALMDGRAVGAETVSSADVMEGAKRKQFQAFRIDDGRSSSGSESDGTRRGRKVRNASEAR
ncbi:hypothetical protein DFJ73DRAFT_959052 [Zopfochytrium polystomum]|nr:hypothetical protein DFJ73DRAFT_959052 [Zopfochytrium polystomum]